MRYYKLIATIEKDGEIFGISNDMLGIGRYDVKQGVIIKNWNNNFCFFYEPSKGCKPTDYMDNDIDWFVVSSKFKNVMETMGGTNIQYLPVIFKNNDTSSILSGYFVANICSLIEALDFNNSDYRYLESKGRKLLSVSRYALKSDLIEGNNIFRLKESNIPIFVSQKFKDTVESNNLTGCEFMEVAVI